MAVITRTPSMTYRKKWTEDDGSPIRPWDDDDDVVEGKSQYGEPIGTIEFPRDPDDNEITEESVDDFKKRPSHLPNVTAKPHIDILLGSGYSVAALALADMQKRLDSGEEFDTGMAGRYHKVIDSFSKLAREERAQEHLSEPEEMTDEELRAFLAEQQQKGLLPSGD